MEKSINNGLRLLSLFEDKIMFSYLDKSLQFDEEEMFLVEFDNETLSSKSCTLKNISANENKIELLYTYNDLEIKVIFKKYNIGFKKNIIIKSNNNFFIKRIVLEKGIVSSCKLKLGHEGLPVFIDEFLFAGIEFPAANNQYENNKLYFYQSPYVKTKSFKSFDVFYGLTKEDIKDEFRKYIARTAIVKNIESNRVYCNWGAYDNLTPNDPILNEKLVYETIDELANIEKKANVKIDYYLMDAFWHLPHGKYLEYDPSVFPHGIDNVLDKLNKNNFKYGLWFDINFIHNKPLDFKKYDNLLNNGSYCFACNQVYKAMEKAIIKHVKNDNLKMIKLDFAYFDCKNPAHNHSIKPIESKEKSISNFIHMIKNIRKVCQDIKILCYNGWIIDNDYIGKAIDYKKPVISPYWTRYVEYLYCGDPRPSEIPTPKFASSLVYYSDAMIRNYYDSFIPFYMIDDHGTMIGNTGTIYRLGKDNYRQTLILNVARGTGKLNLYGSLDMLDGDDYEYYKLVDEIFEDVTSNKMTTSLILGDVRKGEVYGYVNSNKKGGYITIVNPHSSKVELRTHKLLKSLICDSKIKNVNYKSKIMVAPYGNLVCKFKGKIPLIEGVSEQNEQYLHATGNEYTICNDEYNKLYLCYQGEDGTPLRHSNGCGDIVLNDEYGKEIKPILPMDNIWSGVSWNVFNIKNKNTISIYNPNDKVKILYRMEK